MPQLNIDCEGPITQNDNAFELCEALIPKGGDFFARVSRYDDYLADVEKRKGYKAGDTLKLILPFLKAFNVTNEKMESFSEETLILLPGAREMLPSVAEIMPTFIISTSYRPYLEALCRISGFPEDHVYCTALDMDRYRLSEADAGTLAGLVSEIAGQPLLSWPEQAEGPADLTLGNRKIVERLDEIFWRVIPRMDIGRIYRDVNPTGGMEKARAVEDSLLRTGLTLADVFYVGDSITDVQALKLTAEGGGIAMSFNGNSYAVRAAEWACISSDTTIIAALADLFKSNGMESLDSMFKNAGSDEMAGTRLAGALARRGVEQSLLPPVDTAMELDTPVIYKISVSNMDHIIEKSENMRKNVRGVRVGQLG
ncbi:MAG TPA: hypothetical protein EYP57_07780 [Thermodesulfobacteriaceae bacterium]|nr:hypothetical protein [Thermodesulfobacteriaceae bacterium]